MGGERFRGFVKMKNLEKCEICGGGNFEFLFKQRDKNLNFPEKFSLNKCKNCGIIFLNPQPNFEELKKHYSSDKYYSLKKVDRNSKKSKLRLFLYNVYFNRKHKNYFLKFIFSPIKFMVRGTEIIKGKRLLDIGSGSGQFLYEMKQFGLDVYGVEPGEFDEKGNKKEKLNIKKSDLISAKYQEDFFDIITMNHVLEHINNPDETLKEINRILKKDGMFIIGVPNYNSLAYKIFGKDWYQLDVPRHLFNYSDKNLKTLLEKQGFKVMKTRYNSRPNQFVDSLYFALNIKQRSGKFYNFLKIAFLPLTWIVNALKIGDQTEIWCVKQ